MAGNFIQDGCVLTLAAPYDRTSGQGMLVGGIFAVALATVLSGASVEAKVDGVWDLTKVGSQAWAVGDVVYWDNSNKRCTTTGTGNTRIGVAVAAVGSGAGETTGRVRLDATGHIGAGSTDIAALTENAGAIGGSNDGDLPDLTATYVARTGSNGGTANGAYEDTSTAVSGVDGTGSNAASKADVDARLVSIANNTAELQTVVAQLAADNVALRAAVRELATKVNELVAKVA